MPKAASARTRPRIGDIIEVATPRGFAYAQYTHEHRDPPRHGSLLRVLPGLFGEPATEFAELVEQEERFWVFFPLGAATHRRLIRIVANKPVPKAKQPFPIFRSRNSVAGPWWMWDGKREWRARSRDRWTPRALASVWNDTLLIERVAAGWMPADDPGEDPDAVA